MEQEAADKFETILSRKFVKVLNNWRNNGAPKEKGKSEDLPFNLFNLVRLN